jgi:hypothetical protein
MGLYPLAAPSPSTNAPGGSTQRPKDETNGAIDDKDPNIGDDFDDM